MANAYTRLVHRLADLHLAGSAPAFTGSLCDREAPQTAGLPITLNVMGKCEEKKRKVRKKNVFLWKRKINMTNKGKPFIKWVGGKTQLIDSIENTLPKDFENQTNLTYIEPFVGGGAILFWILQKYPNIKKAVINDINPDLTTAYKTIWAFPLTGRAFRSNLLFVPHKSISTSIPNAKLAS